MRISPAPARPKLDIRDLELVLALAATGSTVKAAATLHVTQSAVSRGLLLAEDKLGARLFERSTRGLSLTRAGERLAEGATPLLAQLVDLESRVAEPAVAPTRLRLVCECYTAYRWLPSTLVRLRQSMSRIEVSLAFEHSRDPVAALIEHQVDVALLTTARAPRGTVELPLFADEIVFVVSRDHPLATRKSLTQSDLREHPCIGSTQTPEAEVRWFLSRVFGRARPHLQFIRFPLTEATVDAARAGMGIAILSEWIASPYLSDGDLVVKRLKGPPLRRPWRMAFRREVESAATQLAGAIANAAPRLEAAAS